MRLAVIVSAAVFALGSCSSESEKKKPVDDQPEGKKKKKKSNIKHFKTAMPVGKQVSCENLVPEEAKAKYSEYMGLPIGVVKDKGKTNSGSSGVCALHLAGETTAGATEKAFKKEAKLGILPGDEVCMFSLYCSLVSTADDLKKKCEKDNEAMEANPRLRTVLEHNESLGQYACVRKTDRPPSDWAYTYRTIDPDTKCVFEVQGGPSVVNEELVKSCTRAALETIGPAQIATFK